MSDDLSGFSLMDLFRSEAETNCEILSTGLLAMEQGTPGTAATVEPMMRAAHSLKGAARIVDLDAAVKVAHAMEDVFVAVQNGRRTLSAGHIDLLLGGVDMLGRIARLPEDQAVRFAIEHATDVDSTVKAILAILTDDRPNEPIVSPPPSAVAKPLDDPGNFSLMDLFRTEAESNCAILSEGLLALEQGGEGNAATIEPMMRAAHSLKGAARIVGLEPAVKIAHVMEDGFLAVQEHRSLLKPAQVDTLLRGVDMLGRIAQLPEDQVSPWSVENEAALERLVSEIAAIASGEVAEPPPPAPATQPVMTGPPAALPVVDEPPAAPAEPIDRVVRVTAESLTRLMSLAGESLVQSRQLRPFVDSMLTLRGQNSALLSTLQSLQDRLNNASGVGTVALELLAVAKGQAGQCGQGLVDKMEQIEDYARRSEDLSGRLHHEVLASRMRPLADGVRGFPRLVRDLARTLGKQVQFVVVGENTGVDRDILEKLEAPLNHLIRNALDHAIELPSERQAAGKPPAGTIKLEARHRAGMLQITLTDDGRGIDPTRLRRKIVERGLASTAMAAQLTEAELLEFLFLPGFSTKDKVTEISGRGVGLDVVQSMVRAVGGVVRVSSQAGQGTRFTLQLPITMSVIRALLVTIAEEPYAFPLNRIDRILMLDRSSIQSLEGRQHFMMDSQPIGLVEASQVLGLSAGARSGESFPVVVASDRSHRFGVVVDAFLGERDLEVRPLDARLGKVPNINSASILEDGWPVLIFDVEDLVRSVDNLLSGRRLQRVTEPGVSHEAKATRRVLVVDDSITVRELERQLLENAGYHVEVAVDGVDGWNAVRSGEYHLVISDVDMPRMDGIQFVSLIKQDSRLRSIPVVIVSYKDREADRMRGLDAGANAYLTKSSFRDQTFLQTVVDLIGEANA